jgi:glutathione S-transferase
MSKIELFIGNKNYSSWSLRPWLALRWAAIDFEERVIPLGGEGYGERRIAEVLEVSASGCVPVLHVDGVRIWDSLAICEWAAEQRPDARLWPTEWQTRAACRSVVCEMHAGFSSLRNEMPMNIRRRAKKAHMSEDTHADVVRIQELWTALREEHAAKGAFLFGERTLADAFFVPVCTRFRTYGVELAPAAVSYVQTLLADPDFQAWERAAVAEPWTIAQTEAI